ncbi:MAG TPA: hypothetical protein VIL95_01795 [Bacillota bacterium]
MQRLTRQDFVGGRGTKALAHRRQDSGTLATFIVAMALLTATGRRIDTSLLPLLLLLAITPVELAEE